jgi:hypothetical protein
MPTMLDIGLDADGDLDISGGDLHLIGDGPGIGQLSRGGLETFAGEVFFDITAGARWIYLMSNGGTDNDFAAEARRILLATPGIATVANVAVSRNSARIGTITADCTTDLGALLQVKATVT